MMKVFYLNNGGGGFASHVEVEDGTTVAAFFSRQMPGRDPHDYLIRVDRQVCSEEQVLQEGTRVTITPVKIEGAAAA
jgi:hypothetical protein